MNNDKESKARLAMLAGLGFAILSIAIDTLFSWGIRWKQIPAWIIAGILFGVSMYFYSKRNF